MTSVYVPGTMDGFHQGHRELIDVACKIAGHQGTVILAINSDEFVERHKGVRLMAGHDRRLWAAWVYASDKIEDTIAFVIDQDSEQRVWLDKLRPEFVIHGAEYSELWVCERYGVTPEWFRERGITLLFKPRFPGVSSTKLREVYYE